MQPIRVGVIGAGYWGPNLIRNFYQIPDADLQIVCDLKQDRLDHIESLYSGIKTCQDKRDLIESDIDAVVIATPVSSHYALAKESLLAGKHILVEKPLAENSIQAQEIIRIAKEKGKIVMTGHTFLYNPAVQALKKIIESGELGDIYYINCTRVNLGLYQPDVNVLWDLAPHDVSILCYILGMEPESASARGGMYVKQGVHDVVYVTLNFPNSVLADIRLSWLDPNKIRQITVVGSKKMVVYDDIRQDDKVIIYDKGVEIQPYTDTYEEFHMAYRYGDEVPYPLEWEEPLRVECLQFIECIQQAKSPLCDGVQGLDVIRILEAAQNSLNNGGIREILK